MEPWRARGCPGRRCPSPSPGLFPAASGRFRFLPARWAAPTPFLCSSSSALNTALLLPPEPPRCHLPPCFQAAGRRPWGRGKEEAGRSQMGQVWGSSPAGQVVLGPLPGTWVVPISLGMGESRSGKVWVSIRGSFSLSLSLSLSQHLWMYEQQGLSGTSVCICLSDHLCPEPGHSLGIPAHLLVSLPTCVSVPLCLYLPCLSRCHCISVAAYLSSELMRVPLPSDPPPPTLGCSA